MRRWVFAAALAAIGLAGKPALASYGCGQWGNDEIRCIGNNGIGPHQELGRSARDYEIELQGKRNNPGLVYFNVQVWRSLCGFPGIKLNADRNTFVGPGTDFIQKEHAPYLQCVEFFIRDCKDGQGKKLSCPDVIHAGIGEHL